MNSLTVFEFESQEVEIVVIEGYTWFNASQAAKALGYRNPAEAIQDNVSPKYSQQLDLGRRGSKPSFISEPGLYQLIMRSQLPAAERFQEWVFEEVLPAIRKTGGYKAKTDDPLDTEIAQIQTEIDHHRKVIRLAQKRAELERVRLEVAYIESKPSPLLYGRNSKAIASIDAFIDECLLNDPESAVQVGNGLKPQELYFCYRNFCERFNYEPAAVKIFSPMLVKVCNARKKWNISKRKRNCGQFIEGVRIKPDTDLFAIASEVPI